MEKWSTIAHKKITELIPKQFRFGNFFPQITEDIFPKEFGKGFGNPLLALLNNETN